MLEQLERAEKTLGKLDAGRLTSLAARHPAIRNKLLYNLGRELSARLRRADAEIRALEE